MISYISKVLVAVVAAGALGACVIDDGELTGELSSETRHAPQLNLSHIECLEDGGVQVHFVLVHFDGVPGDLTGTWSGGTLGPVAPYKHTGNVWHYEVILPSGEIDILSAEVDGIALHNPGEYAGDYQCGDDPDVCEIVVDEGASCLPVFETVGDECAYLGLTPIGVDSGKGFGGLTVGASMDAYAAIVRTGTYLCGEGEKWYAFYSDVKTGDILESPNGQYIGQVTYCECPTVP